MNQRDEIGRALAPAKMVAAAIVASLPFRVVIDEYVELAKTFGAEESHKYINGVLDKLARQLRPVEVAARKL